MGDVWVRPPRTTREPVLRADGWVVHYCVDCDAEITDPRFQTCGVDDDARILCDPCGDRARARHREDWWRRD